VQIIAEEEEGRGRPCRKGSKETLELDSYSRRKFVPHLLIGGKEGRATGIERKKKKVFLKQEKKEPTDHRWRRRTISPPENGPPREKF